MTLRHDDPIERLVLRWPPARIALPLADLGAGYTWPALLKRGLRFDPGAPAHRETWAMMVMG